MPQKLGTTVAKLIMDEQREHPHATGDFTAMLMEFIVSLKQISYHVNKAGLLNVLGRSGTINVQDEEQQKLDIFSNNLIVNSMEFTGHLAGMASEEVEEIIQIPANYPMGNYIIVFDPLDGSSNIDANVSIGTIFGIYKRISTGNKAELKDFLQAGHQQVAAGYVIYGSSTMLVISTGHGVNGFTLDQGVGEFILSHPNISTPTRGNIYSVNEGNYHYWDDKTRSMVNWFKEEDGKTNRPYKGRYIGSLVADFHRNLLYGGVFIYPADMKDGGSKGGKLRLLYEASPLAFIAEQAGGAATDGERRILDIVPTELHQRLPLIIGSKQDVEKATSILSS